VTHLVIHDDTLWAGTSRGLFRLTDKGLWMRAAGDPPELRLAVDTFYNDSDGNFWVATNAGLARLSGDAMQQFFSGRDHEEVSQLESIYEDREHNLWLGSHAHGVTRLWNGYTPLRCGAGPGGVAGVGGDAGQQWSHLGGYRQRRVSVERWRREAGGARLFTAGAHGLRDDG
jgi:hypothetical protein